MHLCVRVRVYVCVRVLGVCVCLCVWSWADLQGSWHSALREQGEGRRKVWRGSWNVRTILAYTHTCVHTYTHIQSHTHTRTCAQSHFHKHRQYTTRGGAQLTHCQNVLKFRSPSAWQLQSGDNIWCLLWDRPHTKTPAIAHHLPPSDPHAQSSSKNRISAAAAKARPARPKRQQLASLRNRLVTVVLPSRRQMCYTHSLVQKPPRYQTPGSAGL